MTVVLTLDIDWASDADIRATAAILRDAGASATWLCTHPTPVLDELRETPGFELGVHPNVRENSTQGSTPAEVFAYVMELVPDAVSSRFHGVVQSGALLQELVATTTVRIDNTTFWPDAHDPQPVLQHCPGGDLVRVPFVWSDDYEPLRPAPDWDLSRFAARPGLQVLLFHPVHVARDPEPLTTVSGLETHNLAQAVLGCSI